jgi:hypothetical protein
LSVISRQWSVALCRLPTAVAALLLLGAAGPTLSAAEWNVLERETPRFDAASGSAAGRAAACGEDHAAASQRQFYDFILRYLGADSAAKQLERFELARAASQRLPCDRSLLQRDKARAQQARDRIEPILRDHGF